MSIEWSKEDRSRFKVMQRVHCSKSGNLSRESKLADMLLIPCKRTNQIWPIEKLPSMHRNRQHQGRSFQDHWWMLVFKRTNVLTEARYSLDKLLLYHFLKYYYIYRQNSMYGMIYYQRPNYWLVITLLRGRHKKSSKRSRWGNFRTSFNVGWRSSNQI